MPLHNVRSLYSNRCKRYNFLKNTSRILTAFQRYPKSPAPSDPDTLQSLQSTGAHLLSQPPSTIPSPLLSQPPSASLSLPPSTNPSPVPATLNQLKPCPSHSPPTQAPSCPSHPRTTLSPTPATLDRPQPPSIAPSHPQPPPATHRSALEVGLMRKLTPRGTVSWLYSTFSSVPNRWLAKPKLQFCLWNTDTRSSGMQSLLVSAGGEGTNEFR